MKIIYSLISIFIISITSSFTQVLPNAGFENSTHNAFPSYDAPDGWNNLNPSTTIIIAELKNTEMNIVLIRIYLICA